MIHFKKASSILFFFLCFTLVGSFILYNACPKYHKKNYWLTQRKGANYFNQSPSEEWFIAAKELGIEWVRLAPDKWKAEKRDFLIKDADHFTEISSLDLKKLKTVLDEANKHDIKVVLTLLSLPGSRWKQNNHGKDDLRLWEEEAYRDQAILCWRQIAAALKDHPAIVGYNILNEPHPERLVGIIDCREVNFEIWYEGVKGTLADLNLFYEQIVKTIRKEDSSTPIILDTSLYATPWAISYLTPLREPNIVYSFHMYEPYAFTTGRINKGRFKYPGKVPLQLDDALSSDVANMDSLYWNRASLHAFLKPVIKWQKKHSISSSQMLVGEFGCDRMVPGAQEYLRDLIGIFNKQQWHWAFYSFREDTWDRMDYELGSDTVSSKYWEAVEKGESLDSFRMDNPLFSPIKEALKK